METRPQLPVQNDLDVPGMLGMLVMMATFVSWLLCFMFPVITWVVTALLGAILILCGVLSHSVMRGKILTVGVISLIPLSLFILVQSLPFMQR